MRTTSLVWPRIWAKGCGEVSGCLRRLREPKSPHEQLFLRMKKPRACTRRGGREYGRSTTLRLAIYLAKQSLRTQVSRSLTRRYLMCGRMPAMTPELARRHNEH